MDRSTDAPDPRAIRSAVAERYAARARAVLDGAGLPAADAACCAPASPPPASPTPLAFVDLGAGMAIGAACDPNDPDCAAGTVVLPEASVPVGARNYDAATDLASLPVTVTDASLGCGNPVAIAELAPGESVLDLGSGGGIDCFLAAQRVGASGEVWGLDMTPDMIALARHNAEQMGADNVRFRLGEIEDLPFADAHFDVIMSNCVINLSVDKPRVFREAFRVLKPGGRLRVSDMVWLREPTEAERNDLQSWASCVAGALPIEAYLDLARAAGFLNVRAEIAESSEAGRGVTSALVFADRPA